MPSISEYYSVVEEAIRQLEQLYIAVDTRRLKVADPQLDPTNDWYNALWTIQYSINQYQMMLAVHQYERVSKEKMQALFVNSAVGESVGKASKVILHIKREFDTLRILETLYGVPWQDILRYNNLTSETFETAGEINIPLPVSTENNQNKDIPVFGNQEGLKILGTDLPVELVDDGAGDLLVLDEEDSFAQLIKTISEAQAGDFPFYEDFGLQIQAGEDLPDEAVAPMIQVKIFDGFKKDPRIKEIEVESIVKSGTAYTVNTVIHPIVGEAIKTQVV
jgi:hypothetical protein